jgi:hypothetical protein
MVQFGFFHAPLAVRVVEELQHRIEGLLWIVNNVSKGLSLPIVQKVVPRHTRCWHSLSPEQEGGDSTGGIQDVNLQLL